MNLLLRLLPSRRPKPLCLECLRLLMTEYGAAPAANDPRWRKTETGASCFCDVVKAPGGPVWSRCGAFWHRH